MLHRSQVLYVDKIPYPPPTAALILINHHSLYGKLKYPLLKTLEHRISVFSRAIMALGVLILIETLLLVFDMLLLGVWISGQTLLFVFQILFEISVFGYEMLDTIRKVQ